jgi:Spy/CpxP family protein refolding chaperone
MHATRKFLAATASALVVLLGVSASASAETTWQKDHPRRTEVNHRLANQNRRIHTEVKEGELSKTQAAALHKDDRQIRQEERDMASQDNSHITRADDRALNQQENGVSRQIGQ